MKKFAKYLGGCLLWIVVIIVFLVWFANRKPSGPAPEVPERESAPAKAEAPKAKAPKKKNQTKTSDTMDKHKAWVFAQYRVEERLQSPKSAKFPFGGASQHVEETGPGIFIIRSYVDFKNAFGTEVRQRFFCKLVKTGKDQFELIQLTFE